MRAFLCTSFLLLLISPGIAETLPERSCIVAAAAKLPTIPGLAIIASRMKSVPINEKEKLSGIQAGGVVEIDAKAAGQDVTFGFYCTSSSKTAPMVTSLGLLR
ncbi:hypothetical protein [Bradyrhizobium elkanii]|uniref:Uncharacterized protein n=1 Tax=Bradyrhizobium elkanii TaxID=29448 RepID=A0ABV4F0S7_BRAEL|nr:hypothetical protein [Bradyrhizobium elkanii]MCP1758037.1 hypothetical protein [Bradyrhizobium elkanii]MCP1983354.1 hypothetical protein [Bradyrhizobium elkanii]MCS3881666.1 hypothetical protein [Bradyrhizobium elkanii]MCS4218424.1 hypothetical protein [Bradyrhizobium elkanii]MCW2194288.1 hypothetical protein [Bradyrhizobium elkanii]